MVKLVTFASSRFYRGLEMMVVEAERSGFFNAIKVYRDVGMPSSFRYYAEFNARGYGYWRWKPMVCVDAMQNMSDGDVLVYADAGCTINADGDMARWIELAGDKILGFHLGEYFTERRYTKLSVLDAFNAHDIKDTPQIIGTCIVIPINEHNKSIIRDWMKAAIDHAELFNDDQDKEDPEFIDHRHDQSVLSIMLKKRGANVIPDETYHDGHGNYNPIAPIWATRRR